jgi:plastocyanin
VTSAQRRRIPRRAGPTTLVLLTLALLAAIPSAAAQERVEVTVEARQDCPGDDELCLKVTKGALNDLAPGTSATITFRNQAGQEHNLHAAALNEADVSHQDTKAEIALGHTNLTVKKNASDAFTFDVPDNAVGIYLWCDLASHETQGMWLEKRFDKETGAGLRDAGPGTPLPAALAVTALALAVALMGRRRP